MADFWAVNPELKKLDPYLIFNRVLGGPQITCLSQLIKEPSKGCLYQTCIDDFTRPYFQFACKSGETEHFLEFMKFLKEIFQGVRFVVSQKQIFPPFIEYNIILPDILTSKQALEITNQELDARFGYRIQHKEALQIPETHQDQVEGYEGRFSDHIIGAIDKRDFVCCSGKAWCVSCLEWERGGNRKEKHPLLFDLIDAIDFAKIGLDQLIRLFQTMKWFKLRSLFLKKREALGFSPFSINDMPVSFGVGHFELLLILEKQIGQERVRAIFEPHRNKHFGSFPDWLMIRAPPTPLKVEDPDCKVLIQLIDEKMAELQRVRNLLSL